MRAGQEGQPRHRRRRHRSGAASEHSVVRLILGQVFQAALDGPLSLRRAFDEILGGKEKNAPPGERHHTY
jgi:hypothetical protein